MPFSTPIAFASCLFEIHAFLALSGQYAEMLDFGNKPSMAKRVMFDPEAQSISTTGGHAFVPPGSTDQRGPCPGLNALANHNYLPHNGIVTIPQIVEANTKVFGMGPELALALAIYGAVFDGDLVNWSIGGPSSLVPSLLGLTGDPQGLSGSHNKYEGDGSPTRGDLYTHGNDYLLQIPQFQALYDLGKESDSYTLPMLYSFRATRWNESISTNPYFFSGAFSGLVVQQAAYNFIYRFMGNKSAENPEGLLTGDVLKSFYSITGENGNFTYTPGYERIPDDWYTRAPSDPYGLLPFLADGKSMLTEHPQLLSVGGNTGTTNSFVGLETTLLKDNNLFCFAMQLVVQLAPDMLSGLLKDLAPALDLLGSTISSVTDGLGCPVLNEVDKGQFGLSPGCTGLSEDGTYS